MKKIFLPLITTAFCLTNGVAIANPILLDFEGVGDHANINDFYNGGTDSQGNSGVNYGIEFSTATLGCIDADAGGTCNFANEPSDSTAMFFLDANNAVLNMAAGFDTGFSFYYSSSVAASVNIFDGLNATGNLLGTLNLSANYTDNNCVGDPNGEFCNWDPVGMSFAGTAMSIDFGALANKAGFDNITFGSANALVDVPEPTTIALLGLGLAGLGLARRKNSLK